MNRKTFTRRTLIRGTGGIVVGVPFLASLQPRFAKADTPPTRFVVFYYPEGVTRPYAGNSGTLEQWLPPHGADRLNFDLAPQMQEALTPFKSKLIVTRGIDSPSAGVSPTDHAKATRSVLTAGGPMSIDQVIAKAQGGSFKFRSLEFGVSKNESRLRVIFDGGIARPSITSPKAMFDRMFGTGIPLPPTSTPNDNTALLQALARRRSVLDAVKSQFDTLRSQAGGEDRVRLDNYLDTIRQAEKELLPSLTPTDPPPVAIDCSKQTAPTAASDLPTITKQQIDLLVLALACRLTSVASLQWAQSICTEKFPWVVPSATGGDGLHAWVHNLNASAAYVDASKLALNWISKQMAYLLDKMNKIDEGGGRSLLDNSAVLMTSEFSVAGYHDPASTPYILAGSAGGKLKTGQFLDYAVSNTAKVNKQTNNQFFLGLLKAYGIDQPSFGDPKYGTTPLTDILA